MRDARYENWLSTMRSKWEYLATVAVNRIDARESLEVQARQVMLDKAKVERYAQLMRDGTLFPALIGYRGPKGLYVLITGNHRYHAMLQAGVTTTDMYVVTSAETELYERELLRRNANVVEGDTLTPAERLTNAKFLVKTYGREVADVARHFEINASTLRAELGREIGIERLARIGKNPEGYSRAALLTLNQVQSDRVYGELADLLKQTKLPEIELKAAVSTIIAGGGTEDAMMERVRTFAATPGMVQREKEIRSGRPAGRTPVRSMLFRHLDSVNRVLDEHPNAAALQITTSHDAERLKEYRLGLVFKIDRVLSEYNRRTTQAKSKSVEPVAAEAGAVAG